MAAVDLVLRRSSRIASPKRRHELEQDRDIDNDQLTPRALRALKRQRLTLDSDGLPLPQLETHQRRRKRKENDNFTPTSPLKEVRRRVRHLRIRTRPQNLSKPRHIPPGIHSAILAPKGGDPHQDVSTPPRSPSPIPHYRPPSPVLIAPTCPPSPPCSSNVTAGPPADVIQSRSQSPPPPPSPPPQSQSPSNPPPQVKSNPHPSPPLQQIPAQVDLDTLIPLDPLSEFIPHDPPYTDPPNFSSNGNFSSVHGFPSGGDMNFSPNPPFSSPQESTFSSPGAFDSSHNAFTSHNGGGFSSGFGPHSHEFIPVDARSELSPPQANTFPNTVGFPTPSDFPPSSSGFTTPSSNGFHLQSNDYTQSNGYSQSSPYTHQGAFSQPSHLLHPCEYTPPHRDREVNIWKLACQERVESLLHQYGIETIKALVASQARARYQASPPDAFSDRASSTRFRLYTPASYIERSSYTYKSAEFDDMDFDMDEDADYDDDDDEDDDDECDFGCEYGYNDVDDVDGDEVSHMDVESKKLGEVVVVVNGPERDTLKSPESPEAKTKTNIPMIPIVPPTVPQIPQSVSISSPEDSIPTPIPQIPELVSASPIDGIRSSPSVNSSPRTLSTPHILTSRPPCTPRPSSTHGTPSILQTSSPPATPTPSPQTSIHQIPLPPNHQSPQTSTQTLTLPRTPPLSSLHVTLLSEPPRAFMGRGTPPDRRRLREWGQRGCVHTQLRMMGLRQDVELTSTPMSLPQNVSAPCAEHKSTLLVEHVPVSLGEHASMSLSHGEVRHGEPPPTQHGGLPHDDRPHPSTHSPHQHNEHEHLQAHGEWTSFLFAMLEGDATAGPGWYELGAGVPPTPSVSGPGESGSDSGSAIGMGTLGSLPQGMNTLSVPQTVGEADSTLRFALG